MVLLQEFDLQLVDRKGEDNPVADNLSRMEDIPHDPSPVNDNFPYEQLAVVNVQSLFDPWFADYANLLLQSFCFQVEHFSKGRSSSQM